MKRAARTEIPRQAIYRLSVYLRCLQRLKGNQVQTVSSEALAKAAAEQGRVLVFRPHVGEGAINPLKAARDGVEKWMKPSARSCDEPS